MPEETFIIGCREQPQTLYDGNSGDLPPHKKKLYARLRDWKILDVGCGTGAAGRFLQDKGNSVTGITASEDEAELARKSMDRVHVLDLDAVREVDFEECAYDAILFGDVLEHLKYPHSVLVLSKSLLNEAGQIFVSLPNVANVVIRFGLLFGDFRYEDSGILDKTHLRFFTVRSARQLLTNAGFEIIEEQYSNWNWSILPVKWLRFMRLSRVEQWIRDAVTRWCPGLFATQVMFVARPFREWQ